MGSWGGKKIFDGKIRFNDVEHWGFRMKIS